MWKAGFHHVGREDPLFTITPAPPWSQLKRASSTSRPSILVRGENSTCVCEQNGWLVGWLVGWVGLGWVGWLGVWVVGWLVGWLVS